MLIEKENEKYLVTGFFIRKSSIVDYVSAINIKTHEHFDFDLSTVSIIDGRFPPNFSMMRHVYHDGTVSFVFSIDNEFTDDDFWEKYEDGDPDARQTYYDFLDSLTDLHGLPRIKHPEIIIPEGKPTEEQKRLKALEDELNSYLEPEDKNE